MSTPERPAAVPSRDPYAVFRPRRGRKVATGVAIAALLIFTVGAISLPQGDPLFGGWTIIDRLMLVLIGVVIAALMWRYASIRAVPSREGLVVRNLFTTRRLTWPQIIRVQFGGGAPWVTLDLDDTDTVAVMAIQKADGSFSRTEAGRLSALVQVHGERPDPR
jgi:Bacterial PH domain